LKYYLDTSLIVDFIIDEPKAQDLMQSFNGDFYTSKLGRVETIRSITRFYPSRINDALQILNSIYLLAITDDILRKVESYNASVTLSTADSIHVATAALLLENGGVLVTFDKQMAINAEKLGINTISA
jgi:predicted nucleic acid-binding protein